MKISLHKSENAEIDWIMDLEATAQTDEFIRGSDAKAHQEQMADPTVRYFTINAENKRAGYVILCGVGTKDKSIELGRIVISTPNGGIGQNAIKEILRYAFEELDANRVWLDAVSHNQRAQYVYKKLGFVEEGTLREALLLNGKFHDLVLFGLLRQDWLAS